jgi:hypothetical protein
LPLTSDWDIGDTRKILADEIRARDAAGLKLYDDGSNGIFIADGGQIRINKDLKLENTTSSNTGVIYKGANRFIHNYRDSNVLGGTLAGKNIFIGVNAGNFTMGSGATQTWHGSNNSAMGEEALCSNTTGSSNLAIGTRALYLNTTGSNNVAMGVNTLHSNTTGSSNLAMGMSALGSNTTGNANSAMGMWALHVNTTGYYNSAMGEESLRSNTTGHSNSAMGAWALYSNTTGKHNSAMGRNAGRYQADGSTALGHPENSVYIGSGSKGKNNDDNNTIVIGYNAVGIGANTAVLGNDSIVTTALKGSVGIGTTTPTALLDVNSDILRLRTAKTPATAGAAGNQGDFCWSTGFFYVCVATNTWKRSALTTW